VLQPDGSNGVMELCLCPVMASLSSADPSLESDCVFASTWTSPKAQSTKRASDRATLCATQLDDLPADLDAMRVSRVGDLRSDRPPNNARDGDHQVNLLRGKEVLDDGPYHGDSGLPLCLTLRLHPRNWT